MNFDYGVADSESDRTVQYVFKCARKTPRGPGRPQPSYPSCCNPCNRAIDLGMIDNGLKPEEAKPLTSAPPKLRPRTLADNALPSRSRAFRKTSPPKPEPKPEEKENMPEKEEAAAVVRHQHQAHDAVAVVDLQAWQTRGLAANAMRCDGAPSAGES